jgi:hypothetical protein
VVLIKWIVHPLPANFAYSDELLAYSISCLFLELPVAGWISLQFY